MSHLNGSEVVELSDGMLAFRIGSIEFRICPIAFMKQQNIIRKACDGLDNYEYLDQLQTWLRDTVGVNVTVGQANELWLEVPNRYIAAKKKQFPELTLQSSTTSTPTD